MDTLYSTTYLYLSSEQANRADSSNDNANVSVFIPDDCMICEPTQYIRLTLCQHTILSDLYNVTSTSNTISVNGTEYTLTPGYYKVVDLQNALNAFMTGVVWSYQSLTNKFSMQNTTSMNIVLIVEGTLSYLFGLRPDSTTLTIPAMTTISSPFQIVPRYITDLVIHLGGVSIGPPTNITNLGQTTSTSLTKSDILGIVPLRSAPGNMNVYENISDMMQAQIYERNVNFLNIRTTDIAGNLIADLPPWSAVIKVDVYSVPEQDPTNLALQDILEYIKLFFLHFASQQDKEDSALADPGLSLLKQESAVPGTHPLSSSINAQGVITSTKEEDKKETDSILPGPNGISVPINPNDGLEAIVVPGYSGGIERLERYP